MAYIDKPSELSYYTRNRWIAPPAKMLQPLIVQALQQSHRFRAVVQAPFSGKTTYRLDVDLVYVRQNLLTQPHQMEIALQARLVNNSNQNIIASRLIKRSEPILAVTPYSGVLAANQALSNMFAELSRFCVQNTR